MTDVTIQVPTAIGVFGVADMPGPEVSTADQLAVVNRENREIRAELERLRVTAYTLGNLVGSLVRLNGGDVMHVPRDVSDRMMDCRVTVSEATDGGVDVRLRERSPDVVQIEGGV